MAQHDQVIADQLFPNTRTDLNSALAALFSNNSGGSAPSVTVAYQWWLDATNGILKIRNSTNTAWINVFDLNTASTYAPGPTGPTGPTGPAGPAGTPDYSLTVLKAGDTMTGTLSAPTVSATALISTSTLTGAPAGATFDSWVKLQNALTVSQAALDNTDNPEVMFNQNDGTQLAGIGAWTAAATATAERGTIEVTVRKDGVSAWKSWEFNADGTLYCNSGPVQATDFQIPSDRTLKTDFAALPSVLSRLLALEVKTYRRKGMKEREIGLIAQEVRKQFPELVTKSQGKWTIKYGQMIPLLIAAMQEMVNGSNHSPGVVR